MSKICVLNLSGNVGKSTLAVHLLGSYMPRAKIISVESINASNASDVQSLDVEELSASRFKEIFRELMLHDDVILDVGASNVASFMTEMTRFKSAVGEFDHLIVPTVPVDKQQRDTVATINWLHALGVDRRKVRVVFNQYAADAMEPVPIAYGRVIGHSLSGKPKATYEPHAVVLHNEVYEMAKATGKTIRELAADGTDWKQARAAARAAGDTDALELAIEGQMTHDLALSAEENLKQVQEQIFGARGQRP